MTLSSILSMEDKEKTILEGSLSGFDVHEVISRATKEDIEKVNGFIKDLIEAEIPLRDVRTVGGGLARFFRILSNTYDNSLIAKDKMASDRRTHYDGSGNFIGREFNLLFGYGTLEYDRSREDFDFSFRYKPLRHTFIDVENEILRRLPIKLDYTRNIPYNLRVYPADVKGIHKTYQERKMVDEKLKLAPRISRTIDRLINRALR